MSKLQKLLVVMNEQPSIKVLKHCEDTWEIGLIEIRTMSDPVIIFEVKADSINNNLVGNIGEISSLDEKGDLVRVFNSNFPNWRTGTLVKLKFSGDKGEMKKLTSPVAKNRRVMNFSLRKFSFERILRSIYAYATRD